MNWVNLIVLFLLVGGIEAGCVIPPGKVYTYKYYTAISTGIPNLSSQLSIFALQTKLNVTKLNVKGDHFLYFQLADIEIGEKNDAFPRKFLWQITIPTEKHPGFEKLLGLPFRAKFDNGMVIDTIFEEDDEIWSKDIKKGILDLFQIVPDPNYQSIATDLKHQRPDHKNVQVFKQKELTVAGECLVRTVKTFIPHPSNPHANVVNITKFHNSQTCKKIPAFILSNHPRRTCTECEADFSRGLVQFGVTKINAVIDGFHYGIERAYKNGFATSTPSGPLSDCFTTEYVQDLILTNSVMIDSTVEPTIKKPKSESIISNLKEWMIQAYSPTTLSPSKEIIANITSGLEHLLDEASNYIGKKPDMKEIKKILDYESLIQDGFRALPRESLKSIIEKNMKSGSTKDKIKTILILDMLARTGTRGAIEVIVNFIQENKVTDEDKIISLLQNIPMHIVVPTLKEADIVLDLCSKSKQISRSHNLIQSCYLSFATLVAEACTRTSQHSILVLPAEHNCPRDKLRSYITHIKGLLEQFKDQQHEEMEAVFTVVLGIMGVRDSIHALESRVLGYGTDSHLVRITAIYSLRSLAEIYPQQIRDMLFTVLYNSKEKTENRIAACAVIFTSHPPLETLDKLASYTWHVKDKQVGAFIYSSLHALSNLTIPCLRQVANSAKHALGIANPKSDIGVLMSYRVVVENIISYLGAGYGLQFSFIGEGGSIIPSSLHVALRNFIAGYTNNLFEVTWAGVHMKDVLDKLVGPANMYSQESAQDIFMNLKKNIANQGLNYINEKLGINPRTTEESKMLLMLRLLHYKVSIFHFNTSAVTEYFEKVLKKADHLDFNKNFEWVKFTMPLDIKYVTPSVTGFHLHLDVKLPLIASLFGNFSAKASKNSELAETEIRSNLEPMISGKVMVNFGPVLPCLNHIGSTKHRVPFSPTWGVHYAAGFESSIVIRPYLGGKLEARYSHHNRNLKFSISPSDGGEKWNDFARYESIPYTVIYPRYQLRPISEYALVMRRWREPSKVHYPISFSPYKNIIIHGSHEDEGLNQADILDAVQKRGIVGMVNFGLLTQRMRLREFTIQWSEKIRYSFPPYTLSGEWIYSPAESDPDAHDQQKSYRQFIWTYLTGWFESPQECSDVYSSKPWEYQHARLASLLKSSPDAWSVSIPKDVPVTQKPYRSEGLHESSTVCRSSTEVPSTSSEEGGHRQPRKLRPYSTEDHSEEDFSEYEEYKEGYYSHGKGNNAPHKLRSETVQIGKGIATFQLNGQLEMKGADERYSFNITLKADRATLMKEFQGSLISKGFEPFAVAITSVLNVPKRACYFGAKISDELQKKITGDIDVKFGISLQKMMPMIHAKVLMKKSEAQMKYDPLPPTDSHKPWFYERCERERNKGFLNHETCQMVLNHKAELQNIQIDLDYEESNLPLEALYIFRQLYVMTRNKFYWRRSEDLENMGERQKATIIVNFNYTMPVFDVFLRTSEQSITHKNIHYAHDYPWISPPSTRKSFIRAFVDFETNNQAPSTCLSSGHYMKTFNNNTLEVKGAGTCPYLVTKDCSPGNLFYVLLKNNEHRRDKTLIVGVLKHNITIIPFDSEQRKDIIVDGGVKSIQDKNILYLRDPSLKNNLIAYIFKTGYMYNVYLPYLGIRCKFDGVSLKVEASSLWRNKVCGMCGEFGGSKLYNLIGPQQCAHATDQDLLSQYMVREGSCKGVGKSPQKFCIKDYSQSASGRSECSFFRFYNSTIGNMKCYSAKKFLDCTRICAPKDVKERTVDAYCYKQDDPQLKEVEEEIQLLYRSHLTKKPDSKMIIKVPGQCSVNH